MIIGLIKKFSNRVQFNEEREILLHLSNKKLLKTINISINKNPIKKFCEKLIKKNNFYTK